MPRMARGMTGSFSGEGSPGAPPSTVFSAGFTIPGSFQGRKAVVHASRRHRSAERPGDGADVVVDHADVGSLVGPALAHGVRVQLAADLDRPTARRRAFDQGLHIAIGDGALHK